MTGADEGPGGNGLMGKEMGGTEEEVVVVEGNMLAVADMDPDVLCSWKDLERESM
jgi:hypothetical protein